MLSTAFRLVQRFFPNAPKDRKTRHSTTYKPPTLRSGLAHHSKREQSYRSSLSPSYSNYSSASSASTVSSDCGDSFECCEPSMASEDHDSFMRAEFAKLHVHVSSPDSMDGVEQPGTPGLAVLFRDPTVQRWLDRQRVRDEESKKGPTTQAKAVLYTAAHLRCAALPPLSVPAPRSFGIGRAPRRQPTLAVRKWHGLQKEAESFRADQQVYARVRGTPAARYAEYQEKWAAALAPTPTPTLLFTDIPWPVLFPPTHAAHIVPVDVHQFVLSARLDTVTKAGEARLAAELKRFHPDKFNLQVLPFVVLHQRAAVAEAAANVLDILISARDDIKQKTRVPLAPYAL